MLKGEKYDMSVTHIPKLVIIITLKYKELLI